MVEFLNNTFESLDYTIFEFMHNLAVNSNNILTPIMKFITFLGVHGWFFILLCFVLALFKKTRHHAASFGFSLLVGYILVNLIVKNIVQRPRPYLDTTKPYYDWRLFVYPDGRLEGETSFPSGHVNETVVCCLGLIFSLKSKYKYLLLISIVVMGFSRIYLFAHYFTDVIGGIIFGVIGAICGQILFRLFLKLVDRYKNMFLFKLYLNFDIIDMFSSIFVKKEKYTIEN